MTDSARLSLEATLNAGFSLDGVHADDHETAEKCLSDIFNALENGELKFVHVGPVVVENGEAKNDFAPPIYVWGDNPGSYSGTFTVNNKFSYPPDPENLKGEFFFIAYAIQKPDQEKTGQTFLFRPKELTDEEKVLGWLLTRGG